MYVFYIQTHVSSMVVRGHRRIPGGFHLSKTYCTKLHDTKTMKVDPASPHPFLPTATQLPSTYQSVRVQHTATKGRGFHQFEFVLMENPLFKILFEVKSHEVTMIQPNQTEKKNKKMKSVPAGGCVSKLETLKKKKM